MRDLESIRRSFDDEVVDLDAQPPRQHVHPLDAALRAEGGSQSGLHEAAQQLLREPADEDEGHRHQDEGQQDEENAASASPAHYGRPLLHNLNRSTGLSGALGRLLCRDD